MEKAKRGTMDWALQIAARVWLDPELDQIMAMDVGAAEAIAKIILQVHDEQYPIQFSGYHGVRAMLSPMHNSSQKPKEASCQ